MILQNPTWNVWIVSITRTNHLKEYVRVPEPQGLEDSEANFGEKKVIKQV